jgi:hypothetical protein
LAKDETDVRQGSFSQGRREQERSRGQDDESTLHADYYA